MTKIVDFETDYKKVTPQPGKIIPLDEGFPIPQLLKVPDQKFDIGPREASWEILGDVFQKDTREKLSGLGQILPNFLDVAAAKVSRNGGGAAHKDVNVLLI